MCQRRRMLPLVLTAVLLPGLWPAAAAELQEFVVEPFTDVSGWQVGGGRVGYRLGRSGIEVSREQSPPGFDAALKLTCDFAGGRSVVSAYHTGPFIPGVCQELAFWLHSEKGGADVRLSLEDSRGRWFERELGPGRCTVVPRRNGDDCRGPGRAVGPGRGPDG